MMIKRYKYIWLPILLLSYGIAIAIIFGKDFISTGRTWHLVGVLGGDFAVCVALFFSLKKKESLAQERRDS